MWLISDESEEVQQIELQLLEGVHVGLSYSQGANRPHRKRKPSKRIQADRVVEVDRIVRATIRMHLSESVYFIVQSCSTTFQLWKTLSNTYEKKVSATKIYLIRRLYNLRMT